VPKAKGNTTQRGYGTEHQRLRRQLRATVDLGLAVCWRCGSRIKAGEPWDLGHDDDDRTRYRGPEHLGCNRGAGGRRANQRRARADRHSRSWLG
jgi:hypothetical protein